MDGGGVPHSDRVEWAVWIRFSSGGCRFAQCPAQKVVTGGRFDGTKTVQMRPLQLFSQLVVIELFGGTSR